ncbi:uracil-DNA glycosylase [Rhodobacteraceae bacterium NNCM2]|nr:uracil-DNA glycosylase [Coraliihabitans acroporae]
MDRADLLAALSWQIDLGADEAIEETPLDRFAESKPPAAAPAPARQSPAKGEAGTRPAAQPAARPGGDAPASAGIAQAAQSLEDLHAALAGWDGSDLRKGARNCVFSDGLPGAHLMIIGEAPGADEDRQGKPFVGRAGQLLDRMLGAIGLDRQSEDQAKSAYIANILPWRPPGNRTPSEQEVMAFLPFVIRHIELARPRLLFTIGNTPTKALLATQTGIKRMRGTWRRHGATGLPLLPSFHPAYLLRQPADKRLAWRDLQSLRAVLDGAEPEIEEMP